MPHHLGAEVTLMQRGDRILKDYDPEISELVETFLQEANINLLKEVTYKKN